MKTDEIYSGFRVTRVRELKENVTLIEFTHEKTGAEVCWLKTRDSNKTFAAAFETVPFDDTGVFHILEHSVLNGSMKYPVKDPFVQLMKSSLQTYLNAATFPDKTVYPFSSRNDKDFMNLLAVYMDAVFCPRIYTERRIFEKEGWHYETDPKSGELLYNGVVYNEMKGAFDSVDETLTNELNRLLYADCAYRFNSGGDPKYIPDLTYEDFVRTHARFYHPSHAKIWLEGDLDAEGTLEYMDREYFSKFGRKEKDWTYGEVKSREYVCSAVVHPISDDEEEKTSACLGIGKVAGTYLDMEKLAALSLIGTVLTESQDAPLMKMVLEKGYGKDAEFTVMDEMRYPYVAAAIRNMDPQKFDEAEKDFYELMRKTAEEGLPHAKIRALIDRLEFRNREVKEPAGLIHARGALRSWIYGTDPALYLCENGLYDRLREKLAEGFFEECLKEVFGDLEGVAAVRVIPSKTRAKEIKDEEKKRLERIRAGMTEAEIEEISVHTESLEEFVSLPDSPENLAKLPHLTVEDISEEPLYYPSVLTSYKGVNVRLYEEQSEDLCYLNLYFDVSDLKAEELGYLSVLRSLYTNLPTEKSDVTELKERIRRYTGRFSMTTVVSGIAADPQRTKVRFQLSVSLLKRNGKEVTELIEEVLRKTVWDKEKIRVRIEQLIEGAKYSFTESGDAYAASRILASSSSGGRANEEIQGYAFYRNLLRYREHFDEFLERLRSFEKYMRETVYVKSRLCASCVGNRMPEFAENVIDLWEDGTPFDEIASYPLYERKTEGVVIPSGVSYIALGANLKAAGFAYHAGMQVASQILTLGYLWKKIRDLGGAYGTGCSVSASGNTVFWTYRDPDAENSYREILESARYLEEFDEDISPYIIGTIGAMEPVLSPAQKMIWSDYQSFEGTTYEKQKEERKRILKTTVKDVREFAKVIRKVTAEGGICVFGPAESFHPFEKMNIIIQTLGGEKK